jgi:hypothetical protein
MPLEEEESIALDLRGITASHNDSASTLHIRNGISRFKNRTESAAGGRGVLNQWRISGKNSNCKNDSNVSPPRGRDAAELDVEIGRSSESILADVPLSLKRTYHVYSKRELEQLDKHGNKSMQSFGPRRFLFSFLIILVGVCAGLSFLVIGMRGSENEQSIMFTNDAAKFAKAFQNAWEDYEVFGLWIHESCRSSANRVGEASAGLGICTREEFRALYEYIYSRGLEFQSAQFMPNVTHAQRQSTYTIDG